VKGNDAAVGYLESILGRASKEPKRIVFPEATDPRVLAAAARLSRGAVLQPVLLGNPELVVPSMHRDGIAPSTVEILDTRDQDHRQRCLGAVVEPLRRKGIDVDELRKLLRRPLYYGAAMVLGGWADGMVAGAVHVTADTVRAALRFIGAAKDARYVSSFTLLILRSPTAAGDDVLAFADCGVIPNPNADQLADIAVRTAHHYRLLTGRDPRVALLAFSTWGSASHDLVDKVVEAKEKLTDLGPDFTFDGELQLDAALVPEVARRKSPDSPVAGKANVLIFPCLHAGNIGYKLVERLAGAIAAGPILQGLSRPASDLSRGCSVEAIVLTSAVTAVQAQLQPTTDAARSSRLSAGST
jgi:phosphate acetyltransferase